MASQISVRYPVGRRGTDARRSAGDRTAIAFCQVGCRLSWASKITGGGSVIHQQVGITRPFSPAPASQRCRPSANRCGRQVFEKRDPRRRDPTCSLQLAVRGGSGSFRTATSPPSSANRISERGVERIQNAAFASKADRRYEP